MPAARLHTRIVILALTAGCGTGEVPALEMPPSHIVAPPPAGFPLLLRGAPANCLAIYAIQDPRHAVPACSVLEEKVWWAGVSDDLPGLCAVERQGDVVVWHLSIDERGYRGLATCRHEECGTITVMVGESTTPQSSGVSAEYFLQRAEYSYQPRSDTKSRMQETRPAIPCSP